MKGGDIDFNSHCFTQLTLSPASVGSNTTAEQLFTVQGASLNDVITSLYPTAAQAGLGIVGYRVSAANQIGITFINATASPITPTAKQTYNIHVWRPEKPLGSADALSGNIIFQ